MRVNVAKEVATQKAMSVGELRAKYAQVFGEETRAAPRKIQMSVATEASLILASSSTF